MDRRLDIKLFTKYGMTLEHSITYYNFRDLARKLATLFLSARFWSVFRKGSRIWLADAEAQATAPAPVPAHPLDKPEVTKKIRSIMKDERDLVLLRHLYDRRPREEAASDAAMDTETLKKHLGHMYESAFGIKNDLIRVKKLPLLFDYLLNDAFEIPLHAMGLKR